MVTLNENVDVYKALPNWGLIVLLITPHSFEGIKTEQLTDEIKQFFKD